MTVGLGRSGLGGRWLRGLYGLAGLLGGGRGCRSCALEAFEAGGDGGGCGVEIGTGCADRRELELGASVGAGTHGEEGG